MNFNIYFLLLIRKFRPALTNSEFIGYFGIAAAASLLIAVDLLGDYYDSFWTALRYAFFQVSSVMTTTGFATTNFDLWPLVLKGDTGACHVHRSQRRQHRRRHKGLRILLLAKTASRKL